MNKLRQINQKNQITLPAGLLKAAGIKPGDFLEPTARGSEIILKPVRLEESFCEDDWEALEECVCRQVKKKKYKEYSSLKDAREHLKKRMPKPL